MADEQAQPMVIVGGGLAAGKAAATLRKEGFDGRVIVVTDERREPYERPKLSKEYLRGEYEVEKLLAADHELWTRPNTELLMGRRATGLDLRGRTVALDNGTSLPFGRLLIATGASATRGAIPGDGLDFVHVIRTIDDSDRLRAAAADASSVVVAGGGWIAAEVAASLRQMGRNVTLAVSGGEVLEQRLGSEVGALYSALHEQKGVKLVRGARVTEIVDRTSAGSGSGRGVRLANGDLLPADLVVLGFGAKLNTELAVGAGLAVKGGIIVNEQLETEAPGVFAAGDVVSAWHPRYNRYVHTEHWDTARKQGATAGLNMLGRGVPYDRIPYFYSDQFDLGMETWGVTEGDRVVLRHNREGDGFIAVWLVDGRVSAAMQANEWDSAKLVERLVADRVALDVTRFQNPDVPLTGLLTEQAPA